jgi:hypothetical protein
MCGGSNGEEGWLDSMQTTEWMKKLFAELATLFPDE